MVWVVLGWVLLAVRAILFGIGQFLSGALFRRLRMPRFRAAPVLGTAADYFRVFSEMGIAKNLSLEELSDAHARPDLQVFPDNPAMSIHPRVQAALDAQRPPTAIEDFWDLMARLSDRRASGFALIDMECIDSADSFPDLLAEIGTCVGPSPALEIESLSFAEAQLWHRMSIRVDGQQYAFRAQNLGDWLDPIFLRKLLRKVEAHDREGRRFYQYSMGDQAMRCFFLHLNAVRQILDRTGIALHPVV